MNKQIEDMAKDLQETHDFEGCDAWHCRGCQYEKYGEGYLCDSIKQAEKLTAKGYRKASEVARKIFEEIEEKGKVDEPIVEYYILSYSELAELKKKYESEGGE